MGSQESRRLRGRRRGLELATRALNELRTRRITMEISQRALADQLSCSQSSIWRREADAEGASVVGLSEMAAVLGLELSIALYEVGDPIRDKGHQRLGQRFDVIPDPAWRSTSETLLPNPGDQRSWDRLLRLTTWEPRHLVGVDLETRIRDIQALVRRTRARERDGGVDAILLVLSDSSTNRSLVDELREALGPDYQTPPDTIRASLRDGYPLPGSGVILI